MAGYLVGEWKIRTGLWVKVRLGEHQGKQRLDIREWFMGDEGNWCPSRRGISIPPEHVGELAQMMARAEALLACRRRIKDQRRVPSPEPAPSSPVSSRPRIDSIRGARRCMKRPTKEFHATSQSITPLRHLATRQKRPGLELFRTPL
jgi:hypothetical protein